MKKITRSLAALTILISLATSACAQDLALQKSSPKNILTTETNEPAYINNVNGKVLKSFHKTFGDIDGVKWLASDNGFIALFKEADQSTNVYFRSNGSIQYQVNYYGESKLPSAIRGIVKSNFYDYAITHVSEVRAAGSTTYLIKVEDATSIKTVRVQDEEWQLVEELTKQDARNAKVKNQF